MPKKRSIGKAYENLANAIVQQAAQDYVYALRRLKKDPKNYSAQRSIWEQEKFFHSEWYTILTDADPDYLIRLLKEEVDHDS